MTPVKGRRIKIEANERCDFCGNIIEKGRFKYQVASPDAKALGSYHGPHCYQGALEKYESLQEDGSYDTDEI